MKLTQIIMGMPVSVEVVGDDSEANINDVFNYFKAVDARYSTYKEDSEISQINRGLPDSQWSEEMKDVLKLCEETKRISNGYFDIEKDGKKDPSGLVKGWAINNAAKLLKEKGIKDFYIEAGGDIEISGLNSEGEPWSVGIRNPFNVDEIIKVIRLNKGGIATSGTYIRGEHIYDPKSSFSAPSGIKSLSVIGPDIYEADRFATAAYAMGRNGISFIAALPGFEGYMVDDQQQAIYTEGFANYVI